MSEPCNCPACDGLVNPNTGEPLPNPLARVSALADHYDALAAELPLPHGPVTDAFKTAARDIRRALGVTGSEEAS